MITGVANELAGRFFTPLFCGFQLWQQQERLGRSSSAVGVLVLVCLPLHHQVRHCLRNHCFPTILLVPQLGYGIPLEGTVLMHFKEGLDN